MEIEWHEEDFEALKRRIRQESDRKTFQQVFDSRTLKAIQTLANKSVIDVLEYIISTGKEAHVFVATNTAGNKLAVKIFKKETTHFNKMGQYIQGDQRFKKIKGDRTSLVLAWTRKEFKNLLAANEKKLSVPMPIAFRDNVLVMEFIGNDEEAAPRLKDTVPSNQLLADYKKQVIEFMAGLYLAGLVHADLSEYNILVQEDNKTRAGKQGGKGGSKASGEGARPKKLVVIDFAQALLLDHPRAKEFFERDIKNIANYFTKNGLETGYGELYEAVKLRKQDIERA